MDSERPIEKLLREAAHVRKEQAGPPWEMHPATRRMLEGEVARKYRLAAKEKPKQWGLLKLWPRVAWATGALAVLTVTLWVLLPRTHEQPGAMSMARKEAMPQADVKDSVSAAPAAAPLRSVEAVKSLPAPGAPTGAVTPALNKGAVTDRSAPAPAQDKQHRTELASRQGFPDPAAQYKAKAETTLTAPQISPESKSAMREEETAVLGAARDQDSASSASRRYGLAASPRVMPKEQATGGSVVQAPPLTDSVPESLLAKTDEFKAGTASSANSYFLSAESAASASGGAATQAQWYAQLPSAKGTAAAKPVLASFAVEQSGDKLRIVDADGSVYNGVLVVSTTANPKKQPVVPATSPAPQLASPKNASPAPAPERTTAGFAEALTSSPFEHGLFERAFTVAGTNRSLRQRIVFSGVFKPGTNAAVLNRTIASRAGIAGVPPEGSQIEGKVTIGATQQLNIRAVSKEQ